MMRQDVELTISRAPEPGPLRLVATLALAGAISGLALSSVYQLTLPIIERNNQAEREKAVLEVVPGADGMQPVLLKPDATTEFTVYAAYEGDVFRGWAIEGSASGFADKIRLIFGYDPTTEQVLGMRVLESVETPGLGDKIKTEKNPAFAAQFAGLDITGGIVVVKDGKDAPNEIDAITGATISAKAVAKAINLACDEWLEHLPESPPERETEAASDEMGGEA